MRQYFRLQQFCPRPPPDLTGRVAVHFLEKPAEKLIVGKAVLVENRENRLICGTDVMIHVGQADPVKVLRKRNADILAEHAAEIVAVETEFSGNLIEGQRFHVVLVDIGDDLLDPELAAAGLGQIFLVERNGEVLDQPVQNIQRDRLRRDHVAFGLFDVQCDQIFEAVTDRKISRNEFVGQLRPAADDLEAAIVSHQPLDQVVIDAQNDHHVGVCAARFVNLIGIDDDELTGYQSVFRAFQKEGSISVQNIDKFQRVVPVRRQIFPGRFIFDKDPLFGDVVVLHIQIVRHYYSFLYLYLKEFIILVWWVQVLLLQEREHCWLKNVTNRS